MMSYEQNTDFVNIDVLYNFAFFFDFVIEFLIEQSIFGIKNTKQLMKNSKHVEGRSD